MKVKQIKWYKTENGLDGDIDFIKFRYTPKGNIQIIMNSVGVDSIKANNLPYDKILEKEETINSVKKISEKYISDMIDSLSLSQDDIVIVKEKNKDVIKCGHFNIISDKKKSAFKLFYKNRLMGYYNPEGIEANSTPSHIAHNILFIFMKPLLQTYHILIF